MMSNSQECICPRCGAEGYFSIVHEHVDFEDKTAYIEWCCYKCCLEGTTFFSLCFNNLQIKPFT